MKPSAIADFLEQPEAALLVIIMENVMRRAELVQASSEGGREPADATEAQEAAYVLRSIGEQSILKNDGELFKTITRIREKATSLIDTGP